MITTSNIINRTATFSDDGLYRYTLTVDWLLPSQPPRNKICKMLSCLLSKQTPRSILWVMLNPSTADEKKDDKTVSRIIEISYQNKYTGLTVINLSSMISSNPKALKNCETQKLLCDWPKQIKNVFKYNNFETVVCAWGGGIRNHINKKQIRMDVFNIFKNEIDSYRKKNPSTKIQCLGTLDSKKSNHPCHPSPRIEPLPETLEPFDLDNYSP